MRRKSGDLPILILNFLEEGTFKVICQYMGCKVLPQLGQQDIGLIGREWMLVNNTLVTNAFLCAPSSKKSAFFDVNKGEIGLKGLFQKWGLLSVVFVFMLAFLTACGTDKETNGATKDVTGEGTSDGIEEVDGSISGHLYGRCGAGSNH